MALSRRGFLSRLAGVPLAPRLAWEGSARAGRSLCPLPAPQSGIPAVLLDPGRHGVLHESYLGFVRGLAAAGFEARTAQAGAVPFSSLLIVPGATQRTAAFAAEICADAMRGTRVR